MAIGTSLAACGTSQDEKPPEIEESLTSHPCDVFGPEALSTAGIDGSSAERYDDREEPFQRRTCAYISRDPYSMVSVSFNGLSLSEVEGDSRFTVSDEADIAGHRAVVHDYPRGLQCLASVEIEHGVLEVMVGYQQSDIETADQACSLALQVAEDLAPYFPEHL
ncbi:DUF3558 domain-containing protein [Rhodococcus triatomae]|uniref:DUF3558 domain-containing protein n=1 Tax=Rhodococcus triatomae TaxID=300028 RepID=UPI001625C5AC|nr:DUF3558 domain-containing protein [Rhodococcus triatomae]QNG18159.1 DUF3558 domain-containing protein [Rhodococcus triatomae]